MKAKDFTKEILFDYLVQHNEKWLTKKQISTEFKICKSTVANRARQIVNGRGKYSILTGQMGYRMMCPNDVEKEDDAIDIERFTRKIIAVVTRHALDSKPLKSLMIEARKLLPKTIEERNTVRKYLMDLTRLIDFDEADNISNGN